MNTRQAEPTPQGRHLPGQDHYRTPGPPGQRRGNSEQNKQYMKLHYLPNPNLLFIPPLAGFFFAYMDVGTSRATLRSGVVEKGERRLHAAT